MGTNISRCNLMDFPSTFEHDALVSWPEWDRFLHLLVRRMIRMQEEFHNECAQTLADMRSLAAIAHGVVCFTTNHSMSDLPRKVLTQVEPNWASMSSRTREHKRNLKQQRNKRAKVRQAPVYVHSTFLRDISLLYAEWKKIEMDLKFPLRENLIRLQAHLSTLLESKKREIGRNERFMYCVLGICHTYLDRKFGHFKKTLNELNEKFPKFRSKILHIVNKVVISREVKPYVVMWGDILYWGYSEELTDSSGRLVNNELPSGYEIPAAVRPDLEEVDILHESFNGKALLRRIARGFEAPLDCFSFDNEEYIQMMELIILRQKNQILMYRSFCQGMAMHELRAALPEQTEPLDLSTTNISLPYTQPTSSPKKSKKKS